MLVQNLLNRDRSLTQLLHCRFHLHRLFNILAVLSATAGIVIAWTKFQGGLDSVGGLGSVHSGSAYIAMALGWAMPVLGLIRPKAAALGEKKSKKRAIWEVLHRGGGCASTLLRRSLHDVCCLPCKRSGRCCATATGAAPLALSVHVLCCLLSACAGPCVRVCAWHARCLTLLACRSISRAAHASMRPLHHWHLASLLLAQSVLVPTEFQMWRGYRFIALVVGIVAVFTGLYAIKKLDTVTSSKWYWIQVAVLAGIAILWLILGGCGCANSRRKAKQHARKGDVEAANVPYRSGSTSTAAAHKPQGHNGSRATQSLELGARDGYGEPKPLGHAGGRGGQSLELGEADGYEDDGGLNVNQANGVYYSGRR
jgi:hypothetical protein